MFKPLNDRIALKRDVSRPQHNGIEVVTKKLPHRGVVVAAGPDVKVSVRPGDYVFYGEYAGTDLEHDGEKLVIIREIDLLAAQSRVDAA